MGATVAGEEMPEITFEWEPIGQTEEGTILQHKKTGETKIRPHTRVLTGKMGLPDWESPVTVHKRASIEKALKKIKDPAKRAEKAQQFNIHGVTIDPRQVMSIGGMPNFLPSLTGAASPKTAADTETPTTGGVPGTGAVVPGGGASDKGGQAVFGDSGKYDKYMRRASGAFTRAREAGLEAVDVDYEGEAEAMAQEQGLMREKYEREMREYEALQERQRLALNRVEGEMRLAEQELQEGTIDPNRAYGSLGGRVAAGFAMALGAFAQGLSGGRTQNTAFKIIQGALNRDMLAQKAEMGKRRDVLLNKNNIYAQMMKRFGDERMAEQATINMGLKVASMKIQELATRFKGGRQEAAAMGLIEKTEKAYADGNAKLAQLENQRLAKLSAAGKGGDAKNLFGLALGEIRGLRKKFKKMGPFEAFRSGAAGFLGPTMQVVLSSKPAARYAAARFGVAQFVNKAFSGARGSDRDLAAVMARIPMAWVKTFDEKAGLALIKDLETSLIAAAGSKGYLEKGDIARHYDEKSETERDKTSDWQADFQDEIDKIQRDEGY